MGWGRGNIDNGILDMLKLILVRLEVIEIAQRRGIHIEDVSDEEEVATLNPKPKVDENEERLLRTLNRVNSIPTFEFSTYYVKLENDALLDWIFEIE